MNLDQVDRFEKLVAQMEGVYDELAVLSKKSPTDAVNTFKLRLINDLLAKSNDLLGAQYRPFADFASFQEDDVPQNSDLAFMLAQYLRCFEKMRADNVVQEYSSWYWVIDGSKSNRLTVRPKRLRE